MHHFLKGFVAACLLLWAGPVFSTPSGPPTGQKLPDFTLTFTKGSDPGNSLGLEGKTEFSIPEIPFDVVIIEIFSMYCPHCQREAPAVNRFFEILTADPILSKKITLIGIGAGNSPYEVEVFRKKYEIPFPLFADGDFAIHKKIGEVRTPYFIGVKKKTDGTHEVFYSKLGGFESPEAFLDRILDAAGMKKGGDS